VVGGGRFNGEPPAGHETETTKARSNTERAFTTEFDGDEAERFVARGNEGKVGSAEQVRREGCELRLGENAVRVHFHETRELLRCEAAVEIDNRANSDELNGRALLKADGVR